MSPGIGEGQIGGASVSKDAGLRYDWPHQPPLSERLNQEIVRLDVSIGQHDKARAERIRELAYAQQREIERRDHLDKIREKLKAQPDLAEMLEDLSIVGWM